MKLTSKEWKIMFYNRGTYTNRISCYRGWNCKHKEYECCYCDNIGIHYFGILKIPYGRGRYKYVERWNGMNVVEWIGKRKWIHNWECDECYNREDD